MEIRKRIQRFLHHSHASSPTRTREVRRSPMSFGKALRARASDLLHSASFHKKHPSIDNSHASNMSFDPVTTNQDSPMSGDPVMSSQECSSLSPAANMPSSEATESEAAKPNSSTSPIHPCDIPIQSVEDEDTTDNMVKNSAFYNILGEPVNSNMHCNAFDDSLLSNQYYNTESFGNTIEWNLSGNMPLDIESEIDPGVREAFANLDKQNDFSISHHRSDEDQPGDTVTSEQHSDSSFISSMSRGETPESESADTAAPESEAWAHIADNWKNTFGFVPAAVKEAQTLVHSFRNKRKRPLEDEKPTPSAKNPVSNKRFKHSKTMMPRASLAMIDNTPPASESSQTLQLPSTTIADRRMMSLGRMMSLAHNSTRRTLTPPSSDNGHISDHSADSMAPLSFHTSSSESAVSASIYQPDWKLVVHAHIPPKPTLVTMDCLEMDYQGELEEANMSIRERLEKHPPLHGLTGESPLVLQIMDLLQTGNGFRSQVLTVDPILFGSSRNQDDSELQPAPPTQLVVKVFDPLNFDKNGWDLDPFKSMDQFYTHEAHSYQRLRDLQGCGIPYYYGSYSFSLPLPLDTSFSEDESILQAETATREVRIILLQHIKGTPMSEMEPSDIPQPARKRILRAIVDLASRTYERDIELVDLAPRNIMLVGDIKQDPEVVLIDFGDAYLERCRDDARLTKSQRFLGQYISPLLRWQTPRSTFLHWVDWEWGPWLESEFADTKDTITPEMRELWPVIKVDHKNYQRCWT